MFLLLFFDKPVLNIDMFASVLDKEITMRINQAMFDACVAAALVFGAGASPAREAPATSRAQLWAGPIHTVRDQVLTAVLDAAGEVEARIRQI